jgi:hypothetical protein
VCAPDTGLCVDTPAVCPEGETCNPATGNCENEATDKVVFVTSQTYTGNLGGLLGADTKCQTAATNAGLGGVYKAWISDSLGESPDTRLTHATVPYVRTDGAVVANNWITLTGQFLINALNRDEDAVVIPDCEDDRQDCPERVWTATRGSGLPNLNLPACGNWTDGSGSTQTVVGKPSSRAGAWTGFIGQDCDIPSHLYCFEQ